MSMTALAAGMLMAAYFLLLYAGVGLIQEKQFFGSAPKEVFDAVPARKKERLRGARLLGWFVALLAILLFAGAVVLAAWDGVRNGLGFWRFFVRFLAMLYIMELYDIGFFDWVLLCHSNFFPHFYPEVKGVVGPQLFGYNKKTHALHFALYVPVSAAMAGICLLF